MEENYAKTISLLSDFNLKASSIVSQINLAKDYLNVTNLSSALNSVVINYENISPLKYILPDLNKSIEISPLLEIAREANLAISDLTINDNIKYLASSIQPNLDKWLNQINPLSSLQTPLEIPNLFLKSTSDFNSNLQKLSELSIQSSFAKISEISVLAESSLATFKWSNLGVACGVETDAKIHRQISESFLELSGSYLNSFDSLQLLPQGVLSLGPSVFKLTPVEYFNAADLCEAISTTEGQHIDKELIKNEILIENEIGLQKYLSKLNPDLIVIWQGAKQALESDNPDKIRHFSASLRELFTHVLHIMAPDERIKEWTTETKYFHEGRPTREARLKYICRRIDNDSFKNFVKKDVSATLEFITLFQEGTHKIKPQFTARQLIALKARAESTIKYIIEIGIS